MPSADNKQTQQGIGQDPKNEVEESFYRAEVKYPVQENPLPDDVPRNWTTLAAIILLVAGVIIGFVVPVIGFVFYIVSGFLALVFSIISLIVFRKHGIPTATVGVLICSLFLLGWGIFHAVTFASTAMTVISFMQEGSMMVGNLIEQQIGA